MVKTFKSPLFCRFLMFTLGICSCNVPWTKCERCLSLPPHFSLRGPGVTVETVGKKQVITLGSWITKEELKLFPRYMYTQLDAVR